MAITINGSGTVTGISVGGLPDGIVDNDTLTNTTITDAKIANTTITEGKLAASVNTITHATTWRLTTAFTGNADPIASNWEKNDSTDDGHIGGDMSVDGSGNWTFPSTGIWEVTLNLAIASLNHNNAWPTAYILTTADNSSYTNTTYASISMYDGTDAWQYGQGMVIALIDVTSTTNVKIRLKTVNDGASSSIQTQGSSVDNLTYATFIRLGDT